MTELRVHDNSVDAVPATGKSPKLKLLLHMKSRKIQNLRRSHEQPGVGQADHCDCIEVT